MWDQVNIELEVGNIGLTEGGDITATLKLNNNYCNIPSAHVIILHGPSIIKLVHKLELNQQ